VEVEVPHWAARVTVYDRTLKPVAELDTVRESPRAPGVYEAAADVPPGIYEVEVTLVGQGQRELVAVAPGETVRIGRDAWNLEFSSVAPLAGIAASPGVQSAAAEASSREPTWTRPTGGDSRMFLFVRTNDPKRHPRFSEGLHLLDADHRLVTDFGNGVRTSADEGWLAFTADLPAGYYVLRRGRAGVPVRYQPIYLHAGWETHVFMAARAFPSLRLMTLGMAPLGTGFRADDETMMAVETILATLLNPTGTNPITANEKLTALLQGGHDNPWLDVLAAYSLLGRQDRLAGQYGGDELGSTAALLRTLIASLDRIDAHPDARAVRIGHDDAPPAPFWNPPLLRVGLLRVQRDSTRHVDTVPLDSLTDCVLDNQVTNGPWTSWHAFDRPPRPEHPAPTGNTASRMIAIRPPSESPAPDGFPRTASDSLLLASVVQSVQTVIDAAGPTALPAKIELDTARVLDELLTQVQPEDFSAASGLSLPRAEDGLQQLRRRAAEHGPSGADDPGSALPLTEQEILRYALKKTRTPAAPPAPTAAASDATPAGAATPVTVDAVVASLRTESDRLSSRASDEKWAADGGTPDTARELGRRIQGVSDELLRRADFIVLTGPDDHLIHGNGPFTELLAQPVDERGDSEQRLAELQGNRQAWERAIAGAPAGHSMLRSPVPNRIASEWELWRTVIADATGGRPYGHVTVLRGDGVPGTAAGTLERVQSSMSALRQYASLLAYGSGEHRDEYTRRLQELTAELEAAVAGG